MVTYTKNTFLKINGLSMVRIAGVYSNIRDAHISRIFKYTDSVYVNIQVCIFPVFLSMHCLYFCPYICIYMIVYFPYIQLYRLVFFRILKYALSVFLYVYLHIHNRIFPVYANILVCMIPYS